MQVEARYLIEQSRGFVAEGNISKAVKTLRLVVDSFGIKKNKKGVG